MKIPIEDLQKISQNAEREKKAHEIALKRQATRKANKKHKEYINAAGAEAVALVKGSLNGMMSAARNGQYFYDVCLTENNSGKPTERDQIIIDAFIAEGLKAEVGCHETRRGSYDPDDGGWRPEYDYYIRVKW